MKLKPKKNNISIEIFPFIKEKNNIRLSQELRVFENNKPKFTSITYGASGSIQNNTLSCRYIQDDVLCNPYSQLKVFE